MTLVPSRIARNEPRSIMVAARGTTVVIGKRYFLRKAAVLLEAAELATDPEHAAELTKEAAELIALVEESDAPDDPTELH
jgi:hypothetical protein